MTSIERIMLIALIAILLGVVGRLAVVINHDNKVRNAFRTICDHRGGAVIATEDRLSCIKQEAIIIIEQ